MSVRRFSGIFALCVVLAACSDDATTNAITAPEASFATGSEVATFLDGAQIPIPEFVATSSHSDGGETECGAPNPGLEVLSGTFNRIRVPAGHGCILVNSEVEHDIVVEADTRFATRFVEVGGHIKAENGYVVQLNNTMVEGHIHLRGVGPEPVFFFFENTICGTTVGGNVIVADGEGTVSLSPFTFCGAPNDIRGQLDVVNNLIAPAARGRILRVHANSVGFHADVIDNTGDGNKFVQDNSVARQLRCFGNTDPFVGGPNMAGRARGQCF